MSAPALGLAAVLVRRAFAQARSGHRSGCDEAHIEKLRRRLRCYRRRAADIRPGGAMVWSLEFVERRQSDWLKHPP